MSTIEVVASQHCLGDFWRQASIKVTRDLGSHGKASKRQSGLSWQYRDIIARVSRTPGMKRQRSEMEEFSGDKTASYLRSPASPIECSSWVGPLQLEALMDNWL